MRFGRASGVVLTLAVLALPFAPAAADSVQDKQRQAAGLADRIDQLQLRAEVLAEGYNEAVLALSQVERDVESAKVRLTRQEAELATLRTQVAGAALRSYIHADDSTGVAGLLDPATLSGQGAGRNGYAIVAIGTGLDLADTTRAKLEDTQRQRAALEAEQHRRQQLADAATTKRRAVDAATTEAEGALDQVKGDLVALVAAEEQRRVEESAARQQAQIDQAKAAAEAAAKSAADQAARDEAAARTTAAQPGSTAAPGSAGPTSRRATPARPATTRPATPRPVTSAAAKPAGPPAVARPAPAPAPGAAGAVAAALSQVGGRYVAYQASPATGFDCSGLTMWAWAQAGVRLPHQSGVQYATLPHVPIDQLQPGDLVFIGSPIHHVGMYIGGGQMVHAAAPRWGIIISPIHDLVGAARPG